MTLILGCDPDPKGFAWVLIDSDLKVVDHGKDEFHAACNALFGSTDETIRVAIERVAGYGMSVGQEVFDTAWMSGRIYDAVGFLDPNPRMIFRRDVKVCICGDTKAKDKNIRQAIIDIYGGKQETRKGGKLHGITADRWAALAVALTASRT